MGKSSIYEKIEEKGQLEASLIIEDANKRGQELANNIINDMNDKINHLYQTTKLKCDDLIKTNITTCEQNAKQAILAKKKALIHDVITSCCNDLKHLSDDELTKYVHKCLKDEVFNCKTIMKVNKEEYLRYLSLFSSNQNDNLDKLNNYIYLSNENVNICGGFILECDAYDLDNSYDALLKDVEESLEKQIANTLFGEE